MAQCLGNILKPHPEEKQESRMENAKIQAGKNIMQLSTFHMKVKNGFRIS